MKQTVGIPDIVPFFQVLEHCAAVASKLLSSVNVFLRPFRGLIFIPWAICISKHTMLLCLLSNKNTTHVVRSTKLNKKEKKLYVDAPDESIFGWTKAVAPMLFFLGHYFVIGLWNSILLTKKKGFFCCLFCFVYAQMAGSFDCHQNGWKILRMVDSIGMLQIYQVNVYFVYKQKKPKSSLALTRELVRTWRIKRSFSPVPLSPVPFCPIPLCPEGKLFALIYLQIIICPKIICLEIRNSHR